jgi:hypothetical protein
MDHRDIVFRDAMFSNIDELYERDDLNEKL